MELSAKQSVFKEQALAGHNLFLTGKAGTGKSFILRDVMEEMRQRKRKFIAVAPTGIAATNIDGATIHSQFAIQPFGIMTYEDVNFLKGGKKEVLSKAETVFVDEISMLRPDLLDAMHWTLKKNSLKGLDSKQIIFCGDLKQLPPVLKDNERTVMLNMYQGETFLHANIMDKLNLQTIELDEVLRQTNEEFIHNLNIIREGGKAPYFRQFFNKQAKGVVLAPHNATVAKYNAEGLAAQPGREYVFKADIEGNVRPQDFIFEQEIRVKHGCKIMYLVNSDGNNNLRNGTLGTFVVRERGKQKKFFIKVGEIEFPLEKMEKKKKEYVYERETDSLELRELGSITQYPFKLAYALSIHKAQGLTFEEVTLDLRMPTFQPGQLYVGLSRVTGPEGLRIITN